MVYIVDKKKRPYELYERFSTLSIKLDFNFFLIPKNQTIIESI